MVRVETPSAHPYPAHNPAQRFEADRLRTAARTARIYGDLEEAEALEEAARDADARVATGGYCASPETLEAALETIPDPALRTALKDFGMAIIERRRA